MPNLVHLPVELLQDIFIDLREDPWTERESLLSLCRTCRRLRAVAQPFLYLSTDLPRSQSRPLEPLACLTRTIVARPDLASKIKSLSISTHSEEAALPLDDRDYEALKDVALKREVDGEEKEDRTVNYDQLAIVLFSHLDRLEKLNLEVDTWPAKQLLKYVQDSAHPPDPGDSSSGSDAKNEESKEETKEETSKELLPLQPRKKFPSLKHLTVSPEGPPFNLADFTAFLTLPTLQTARFTETLASTGHAFGKKLDLPPSSIHISRLVLEKCFMREKCLRQLLTACTSLKMLRVSAPDKGTYNWHGIDVGNTYQFTPEHLVNAISKTECSATLEALSASFTSYYPAVPHIEIYQWPSMRHLVNLKTLSIEHGLLPELERLPKRLITLRLVDALFATVQEEFFENLVLVKKKWCKEMEKISVEGYGIDERVIELAKAHGGTEVSRDAEGYHRIGFVGLGCGVKVVDVSFFDEPGAEAFVVR